jgi:hypothetical protein
MTAMNVTILEKIARQVLKGEGIAEKSTSMLNSGVITPAEHRSVKSLSWQIAANVQANNGTVAIKIQPLAGWL